MHSPQGHAFIPLMKWSTDDLRSPSVSHFFVRSSPVLSPNFNQIGFAAGYGSTARVGFNVVGTGAYDISAGFLQFSAFQVSYNNDCCGISFEYRRFALGPVRNKLTGKCIFRGTRGSMDNRKIYL